MDQEILEAARIHAKAVKIIAVALSELSHTSLTQEDHERNAAAILARLAHANLILEHYDETNSQPQHEG